MKNIKSVSTLQVLDVLSDRISIDIFNAIAEKVTTSDNITHLLGISQKQVLYTTCQALGNRLNQTEAQRTYSYIFWTIDIPSPVNNRNGLQALFGITDDRRSKVNCSGFQTMN